MSYIVSVTVPTDYWGDILVDFPYTEGYSAITSGPADNWDPGDAGDWDLNNAKVTFLELNMAKSYELKKLAPRVSEAIDSWLDKNIEKWQPEVEEPFDYEDDDY